ncbi:protein of unknown function DUF1063 [Alkaliphilus metalliredigens QYMF]|uniref:UPF0597 protein Amet_4665 n=1 Tax=Alkaliphilus metalliredigens (strain QYMF) TaxID=293826 RepID=Y4665_ALKMQ|nr:L-serine ammonia-lyase, iron-sulfur-dependent, subunit alpha [Alkaliphilus metalliredigens]A6TX17.1 RecName: Full=UPF0597 protein Amet_4665 [Alkaliphilus metalliredigens QYMF]ABR50735.1 protein of unknown function DUF1063 [Alkaliphilus metalliredigens QYMF]
MKRLILETLKAEVVPAIGCTEPIAVALACAKAREIAGVSIDEVDHVDVIVSPNVYKNGLAVGVPHTEHIGLAIAAALGLTGGKCHQGLQVLEGMKKTEQDIAVSLMDQGLISLDIKDTNEKVYIEVILSIQGWKAKVIIKERHNQFVYLEKQGHVLLDSKTVPGVIASHQNPLYHMEIKEIIAIIEQIPHEELAFMMDGVEMNKKMAMTGLQPGVGMGVGYTYYDNMKKGILSDDIMNQAMMLTAAASDARMSGSILPVMSSNGSGNNGITAILPIVAYGMKFQVEDEKMAKALAISHLMNSYIKHYIGRLSALCGCGVAAGTGASVAIAWLMGAKEQQIDGVIKNMLANVSGMICDGAKVGCALKLATSAQVAIQSALLAMDHHIVPTGNGIVAETAEGTIENLRILSEEGMQLTDHAILSVMMKFQRARESHIKDDVLTHEKYVV